MVKPAHASPGPARARSLDVVVRSRHLLVAQAVGEALRRRGLAATVVPWQRGSHTSSPAGGVVLLIDELGSRAALEDVRDLVLRCRAPVLVLGARQSRTAWGAVAAAGVAGILPGRASLEMVEDALHRLRAGEPVMEDRERERLVEAWTTWQAEEVELERRVATLSAREASILGLLSEGHRAADAAEILGVSESTVRTHVKSLRRKLGVDSQLAAVAVVRRLLRGPADDGPVLPA